MLGLRVRPPVSSSSKRGTYEAELVDGVLADEVSSSSKRGTYEAIRYSIIPIVEVSSSSKRGTYEAQSLFCDCA